MHEVSEDVFIFIFKYFIVIPIMYLLSKFRLHKRIIIINMEIYLEFKILYF
jgi:hypothetical protein